MIGMHYTFPLPDDYDMVGLRARIEERGPLFNKVDGLHQKAFLVSQKGVDGAVANCYAPFYFWKHGAAISEFLVSDNFRAVSQAFGRPNVGLWLPLYFASGQARFERPTFATKESLDLPADADLAALRTEQYALHRKWATHPENQSSFIGIHASSWKLVRFALWTLPQESLGSNVERFEVLHLAAPGLDPNYFAAAAC